MPTAADTDPEKQESKLVVLMAVKPDQQPRTLHREAECHGMKVFTSFFQNDVLASLLERVNVNAGW